MARSLSACKPEVARGWRPTVVGFLVALLAGCGTAPLSAPAVETATSLPAGRRIERARAQEIVLRALALIDTGYVFGGRNPDAGLDCSGMVAYVYEQAAGLRLPHNAAQIARLAQPVPREQLGPGDLVFFNTRGFAASHVGIYLGDGRFVHAPSSKGRVRIESMDNRYFAPRFEGGRTLFAD